MIASYNNGRYLLVINGAVLAGCTVFDFALRDKLLIVLLLFLPFIDRQWSMPKYIAYRAQGLLWGFVLALVILLVVLSPAYIETIIVILFFIAIPEEWFFRSYFMQQLESLYDGKWVANFVTSSVFALLHVPLQGWIGFAVFVPSLFFGWLYQRDRDLILVILLHVLFNGIFIIYLRDLLV